MLSGTVKDITGGYILKYNVFEIDFTPPFIRIDMVGLEQTANLQISRDLSSELCNAYTELTLPVEPHERFARQLRDRMSSHDETMALN